MVHEVYAAALECTRCFTERFLFVSVYLKYRSNLWLHLIVRSSYVGQLSQRLILGNKIMTEQSHQATKISRQVFFFRI
jgi:hypothetical protein